LQAGGLDGHRGAAARAAANAGGQGAPRCSAVAASTWTFVERLQRNRVDAVIAQPVNRHVPGLQAAVRAVLEQPVPNALNGKFSWFQVRTPQDTKR